MEPEIAFRTGYLMGYLSKKDVDVLPVFDEDGNYLPRLDIAVPADTSQGRVGLGSNPDGDTVTIRVEVIEVLS